MAATITKSEKTIEITGIDADVAHTDIFASLTSGFRIHSIQFNPGAADNVLVIKEGGAAGAGMFRVKCKDTYDQKIKYYSDVEREPFIDFGDCTLAAGHSVIIELY